MVGVGMRRGEGAAKEGLGLLSQTSTGDEDHPLWRGDHGEIDGVNALHRSPHLRLIRHLRPLHRRPGLSSTVRRCRPLLGTYVDIQAERPEEIEAGYAAVDLAHRLMSVHEPGSDLSRLNLAGSRRPVLLHPWTAAVLRRALFWAEASDGVFDPTVGARMQSVGLIPRHADQPVPDPHASWRDVVVDGDEAWFGRSCLIDLGGIAKGFAVDAAVAAMKAAGAARGLVNAGGDLHGFGEAPWYVDLVEPGTRQPFATLSLCDRAAATSAILPGRGGGSHLPGRRRRWRSATVTGPSAMDADALTKVVLADPARTRDCLKRAGADAIRLDARGWEAII